MPAHLVSLRSLLSCCALACLVAATAAGQAAPVRGSAPAAAKPAAVRPAAGATGTALQIDRLFADAVRPDRPAVAVIVVKDGKTLLRKAYGLANVELGVPARPEMVFRIGSVTKQFTAAAIMLLVEEGKVALSDDIRKYLPDFPTHGHAITVENLLTHTSGIWNFTESMTRPVQQDMTPAEVVALFSGKPLQFTPGERWSYSNSGYFLLGVVIEKASGQTYADFMQQRVFDKLGMAHTLYDRPERIVPGRVGLYAETDERVVNAEYISLTQPFSAGAIASSVDDLATWNAALDAGALLSKASVQRIFTSFTLNNGKPAGYGYGWGIASYEGHLVHQHSGGIQGGRSFVLRMPDDHLFVAVVSNLSAEAPDPAALARKAAALAIGKPVTPPAPATAPAGVLERNRGFYVGADGEVVEVKRDGGRLLFCNVIEDIDLEPLEDGRFYARGDEFTRYSFDVDPATRQVTGLVSDNWGRVQRWQRAERPPQGKARTAIAVDGAILDRIAGEYQLETVSVTVTREGDHLALELPGRPKFELFPESEAQFFRKDLDVQVSVVRGPSGNVTSLVLHHARYNVPLKRRQK